MESGGSRGRDVASVETLSSVSAVEALKTIAAIPAVTSIKTVDAVRRMVGSLVFRLD
jgi:hypothetical protein